MRIKGGGIHKKNHYKFNCCNCVFRCTHRALPCHFQVLQPVCYLTYRLSLCPAAFAFKQKGHKNEIQKNTYRKKRNLQTV